MCALIGRGLRISCETAQGPSKSMRCKCAPAPAAWLPLVVAALLGKSLGHHDPTVVDCRPTVVEERWDDFWGGDGCDV